MHKIMNDSERKEKILKTITGENAGYIPVIPLSMPFAIKWSGQDPEKVNSDPRLFAEVMVKCRQEFDYDGQWVGGAGDVIEVMGRGLIDKFGKPSVTGEAVVKKQEDIEKLHEFHPRKDMKIGELKQSIDYIKKHDPGQPIFTVVSNPACTAALLMDVGNFYVSLIKRPEFVKEVIKAVTQPLIDMVGAMAEAGVDVIWAPAPILSGTCISRKHYEKVCMESSILFNKAVKDCGARLIVHTCGDWNDRYDLVVQEGADCLHLSETSLADIHNRYHKNVALMGMIPSVPVMLFGKEKDVYEAAKADCMTAALDGGFLLSPDCGMPPNVPEENVRAMVRAARDAERLILSES